MAEEIVDATPPPESAGPAGGTPEDEGAAPAEDGQEAPAEDSPEAPPADESPEEHIKRAIDQAGDA